MSFLLRCQSISHREFSLAPLSLPHSPTVQRLFALGPIVCAARDDIAWLRAFRPSSHVDVLLWRALSHVDEANWTGVISHVRHEFSSGSVCASSSKSKHVLNGENQQFFCFFFDTIIIYMIAALCCVLCATVETYLIF